MRRSLLLLLVLPSCAVEDPARSESAHAQMAEALVRAEPRFWPERGRALKALGPAAAPALIAAVRDHPEGAGVQLALGLLGRFGDPLAVPLLEQWIESDRPHAYEAGLALGRIGERSAAASLRRVVANHDHDPTNRTAAACALFDLGEVVPALPLLFAVLVAGTPDGIEPCRTNGLPVRTRWALERNLVIDAIRRNRGGNDFGLDSDSPWPKLAAAARRFRDEMQAEIIR